MSDPRDKKASHEPMPKPISKPRPPEMDLEPIPLPDLSGASQADEPVFHQGQVPPVPSRHEINMEPDEALPDDTEEEILKDSPGVKSPD